MAPENTQGCPTQKGFDLPRASFTVTSSVPLPVRMTGAFTAFAAGYLLDAFTGRPTGLYPFLAVLTFLLVRAAGQVVDGRSRGGYALFVAAATFGHALLALFFGWLTARQGGGAGSALAGVPLQVLLSTVAGVALFPLLKRIEPGDHPEPGGLR